MPKTIRDIINELYEEKQQSGNLQDPNPAENPAEYIDVEKKKRRGERRFSDAKKLINDFDIDINTVKAAYEKAVGKDKLDEVMDNIRRGNSGDRVYSLMVDYIMEKRQDLMAEIPADKKNLNNHVSFATTFLDKWEKENRLSQEEIDRVIARRLREIANNNNKETHLAFVSALDELMTPEKKQLLINKLESHVDILDLPEEDYEDHIYEKKADRLKSSMPQNISNDPEKKAQYEHVLTLAAEKVTLLKSEVSIERRKEENDCQHIEAEKGKVFKQKFSEYKNGKYNNMFMTTSTMQDYEILNPEKRAHYKDFMKEGVKLSDKTKQGMRLMIEKMKAMGLEKYPHDPSGEDGGKIYGFNKYNSLRKEFENALNKENPDPEEIIAKGTAFENTLKEYEELYKIAEEYFSNDPYYFPGNMDSVRNAELPYKFTGRLATTAQVNAMFMNYINYMENSLDIDKYLEDPIKETLDDAIEKIKGKAFENDKMVDSLEEAIEKLTSTGKYEKRDIEYQKANPTYGLPRQIATPSLIEQDKKTKEDNLAYKEALENRITRIINDGNQKFSYLRDEPRRETERSARLITMQNLMVYSGEKINTNAMFYDIPETDTFGDIIGAGFDMNTYMEANAVDYVGIMDRAERMFKKYRSILDEHNISIKPDMVLEATAQLYSKILLMNPQDKERPEFRKMREEFINLPDRLSEEAKPQTVERIKALRDTYLEANPEVRKPRIWERKDYAYPIVIQKFPQPVFYMFRDDNKTASYHEKIMGISSDAVRETFRPNDMPGIEEMYKYNPVTGDIRSADGGISFGISYSPEYQKRLGEAVNEIISEFKSIHDKEKDSYVKRIYSDYITYLKIDPLHLAKMIGENYDISLFYTLNITTVPAYEMDENTIRAKETLGRAFYDHLDMTHWGMEEIRIEDERLSVVDRLKEAGKTWGEAEEKTYAQQLRKAHSEFLKYYERLDRNYKPEALGKGLFQNGLNHDFGRGATGNERDYRKLAGKVRGELKALDMGWNTGDMAILGYIGRFDAQIEKYQRFGRKLNVKGLTKAAREFKEIKEKFWNKRIETNADKKEAADAIWKFYQNNKNCQAVSDCVQDENLMVDAINKVSREAAKTAKADYEYQNNKKTEPDVFLQKFEEKGDIRGLARAIADYNGLIARGKLGNKSICDKFRKYVDGLMELDENNKPKKGWSFIESLHKEISVYAMEQNIIIARSADELANDIRNGISPYSKTLGNLGKDYKASNEIADAIVCGFDNAKARDGAVSILSEMNMIFAGLEKSKGKEFDIHELEEKYRKEYLESRTDYFEKGQAQEYLNRGSRQIPDISDKYGINVDDKNIEIPDQRAFKSKTKAILEKTMADIVGVKAESSVIIQDIKDEMPRLENLKSFKDDNSDEFMAMYNAVREAAHIDMYITPREITEALKNVEKAAKDYRKAKIEDNRFTGRKGNGAERVKFADDMIKYAGDKLKVLSEKITENVSIYDQIEVQAREISEIQKETVREKVDIKEISRELENENPVKNVRRNSITKTSAKVLKNDKENKELGKNGK